MGDPAGSDSARGSSGLVHTLFPRQLVLALSEDNPDCSLTVLASKDSAQYTAFKIKCTDPSRYEVRPVTGYLAPGEIVQVSVKLKGRWQPEDQFLVRTSTISDEDRAHYSPHDWWEKVRGKAQVDKHILPVTTDESTLRLLAKNASLKAEDRLTDAELERVRVLRDNVSQNDWERLTRLALSSPAATMSLEAQAHALEDGGDFKAAQQKYVEWAVQSELARDEKAQAEACRRVALLAAREGKTATAHVWHEAFLTLSPQSNKANCSTTESMVDVSSPRGVKETPPSDFALKMAAEHAREERLAALARLEHALPAASPRAVSVFSTNATAPTPSSISSPGGSLGGQGALGSGRKLDSSRALQRQRQAQEKHVERARAAKGGSANSSPANGGGASDGPFHMHVTFERKSKRLLVADTTARALELTVRDLKRLVVAAFDIAVVPEEEVILSVGGNALTETWRGQDFGLRPTTRIEASVGKKPRRGLERLPVVVVDVETLDTPPPKPPSPPLQEDPSTTYSSPPKPLPRPIGQVNKIEPTESPPAAPMSMRRRDAMRAEVEVVATENARLKKEVERLQSELKAARSEATTLKRACELLTSEKARLAARLKGDDAPSSGAETPALLAAAPRVPSADASTSLGACCVAAPSWMLVPSPEEDEDFVEGVEVNEEEHCVRIGKEGDAVAFKAAFKGSDNVLERLAALVADDVVDAALEGASSAVFVWGESLAGKSAMMEGLSEEAGSRVRPGLMDLVCRRLFGSIAASAAEAGQATRTLQSFVVKVSAFQVDTATGVVSDLLKHGKPVMVAPTSATARLSFEGCTSIECTSTREFEKVIAKMDRPRRAARGLSPRRGDPLADSLAAVVQIEIQLPEQSGDRPVSPRFVSFLGRIRFVELPGAERFLETGEDPIKCDVVARMMREAEGRLSMVLLLHPAEAHAARSRRLAEATLRLSAAFGGDSGKGVL